MTHPLTFALAVITLLAVPGPTNTLMAAGGGLMGFRRALKLIPSELLGYSVGLASWSLVLGLLGAELPAITSWVKVLPVLVLIGLALKLWRHQSQDSVGAAITRKRVFITTVVNPKALLFATHIIPGLVEGALRQALPYVGAFMVMCIGVATGWVGIGTLAYAGPGAHRRSSLIRQVSAVVLLLFALTIVASMVAPWWQAVEHDVSASL